MSGELYFMVEGGKTLDIVKRHIASIIETKRQNADICKELGASRMWPSVSRGTVAGVAFDGERHPDFNKPNRRGASYPRKGTEWAKRFADQAGYDAFGYDIAKELGVPTSVSYASEDGKRSGTSSVGGFHPVGFLFLSSEGPYALWISDVEAAVQAREAEGYIVDEPARSFRPEFDGTRRILKEEWDLLVAEHQLAEARAKAAKARAA